MNRMKSIDSLLAVFIILVVVIFLPGCENRRLIKITNFKCEAVDKKFGVFKRCEVKAIQRDVSQVDIHYHVLRLPLENVTLNLQVKRRGNALNPILYNIKINCCDFLANRRKNPLTNIFYQVLGFERFSNLNHTCPYYEDVILAGYRVDEEILSAVPMPFGDYGIILEWSQSQKIRVRNEVYIKFSDAVDYQRGQAGKRNK